MVRAAARRRDLIFPFLRSRAAADALRPHRPLVPVVAGLSAVAAALDGVAIVLLVPLFGLLLNEEPGGPAAGLFEGRAREERAMLIVGLLIGLIVAKNAVTALAQALLGRLDARVGHALRGALARLVLTVGYPYFLTTPPHGLVNVVSGESWRATEAVRAHAAGLGAGASVLGYVLILLVLDWRLALGVLLVGLLIRAVEGRLTARTSALSGRVTEANDALARRMLSMIHDMRLVRVFGAEAAEGARYEAASAKVAAAVDRVWRSGAIVSPLIEVLYLLLFAGLLVGFGTQGQSDLPRFAAFLVVLQRAQPHLRALEQARVAFSAASGGLRRVEALLDDGASHPPPGGGAGLPPGPVGEVSFRAVAYAYPGTQDREAARLGDAVLRRGETVALTGPSGSGKSTLIALVCRLIEPSSGLIRIDGRDLAEIAPAAWRARLALAGQDTELTDGSVRENVAYGAAGTNDDALWSALRDADAEGFVRDLPGGLDTEVGSRGVALSGGQRQRIGLARAFLRDADLLILDEATSALDAASEARVLSAVRRREGITLLVSHDRLVVESCDREIALG